MLFLSSPYLYRPGLAAKVYRWVSYSSHSARHWPSITCIWGISRHASCACWLSHAPQERNFLGSSMLRTKMKDSAPSAFSNDHSMKVVHALDELLLASFPNQPFTRAVGMPCHLHPSSSSFGPLLSAWAITVCTAQLAASQRIPCPSA